MTKNVIYSLIAILFLVSCNSNNAANTDTAEKENIPVPPKSEGSIRVLFVGNSHTEYFASFPLMLEALSKENNKDIEVCTLIKMGVSIDKILKGNQKEADKLFAKSDADGNYFDYIILQESTPVAAQKADLYIKNCKMIHDLASKNSPDVATYIYELTYPTNPASSDFKSGQNILTTNARNVADSLPNAGVLKFAQALKLAYKGEEGYEATQNGKDMLRHTDTSHHMLNDAVFMNSIILYQTIFGESPKIPQQLPLSTGTGNNDEIALMDVSKGVSNPQALEKIAASFK